MVVSSGETGVQADVVFAIEGTALNGAYINDLKSNYIVPTLEYFSPGNLDDREYATEYSSNYGIVVYHAADCIPNPSSDTFGPFSNPSRLLVAMDKLELIGGKGESHANIAEGLATSLQCFEELQSRRDSSSSVQKHCILVCNSPPYMMPVMESHTYSGKTYEQLAVVLQEKGIHLSILSPRKIPALFKLFERAGGDLSASQTKNYAKDPRHLVLLKGYNLKERPVSPPPVNVGVAQSQPPPANIPIPSLPSPLPTMTETVAAAAVAANSTQPPQNMMGGVNPMPVGAPQMANQNQVFRAAQNQQDPNMFPSMPNPIPGQSQVMVPPIVGRPGNMPGPQFQQPQQQIQAPPGYHSPNLIGSRPPARWPMMPPQPRPHMQQNQQQGNAQGSALIAQLTQPPSTNQFNQNTQIAAQQAGIRMPMMGNQPQPVQNPPPMQLPQPPTPMPPQSQTPAPQQVAGASPIPTQANQPQNQAVGGARERHTIWQGMLEWLEKAKNPNDQQKVTRQVPCQVSAATKDGEPELKAENWPLKLIMQLMPKQLIGSIGGIYLKNSKTVLFHPQQCQALESLTKVMNSSFAGCVHFTSQNCDIKVLILLYTAEKRAYLGFIPNDQVAFVDRLRKVIQEQKSNHAMLRQGQGTGQINPNAQMQQMTAVQGPLSGSNPPTSQPTNTQQGIMMPQTSTMAMGGGQIAQNVTSTSQPGPGSLGPAGTQMNFEQGVQQQQQPGNQAMQGANAAGMRPTQGMMGSPAQQQAFDHARQQNLEKILQLQQNLKAAQQQELQYKSQLEFISHMKTQQIQEALHAAQQEEMQYKMMEGTPQQQQQQRLMRPVQSGNPGLRHLLQQQPQYRQQMIMPQMGGAGPRPQQMGQQMPGPANQQQFDDVSNYDMF